MKKTVNIYFSEERFFRRIWLKRVLTKIVRMYSKGTTIETIKVCKNLFEVRKKIAVVSPWNLYYLHVDLANEEELAKIKAIRQKDPLGKIVLFVENTWNLGVLFEKGLSVLDYQKMNSPKEQQIKTIKEAYVHLLIQVDNDLK
ncbi:hypothetical protein ACYSNW_06305 [Enterococcus sp. LJL99]